MEKQGIIYKWTNLINGKSYIGQTLYEDIRKQQHINGKHNNLLYKAINKYGLDNFNYEVLEYVDDESKLSEREIYWISYFDSYKHGYNLTLGGEGTRGFSHTFTTEQIAKLSESHKGIIPWNKGKTGIYSEEHKKKIGSRDHKACWTEELKKQQSEKLKGRTSPNKGKKLSDETKQKISESVKKSFAKNNTSQKLSIILKGKPSKRKGRHFGTNKIHSETMKNKVHVNNGEIAKMIDKELINEYLSNGWKLGRLMKKSILNQRKENKL